MQQQHSTSADLRQGKSGPDADTDDHETLVGTFLSKMIKFFMKIPTELLYLHVVGTPLRETDNCYYLREWVMFYACLSK